MRGEGAAIRVHRNLESVLTELSVFRGSPGSRVYCRKFSSKNWPANAYFDSENSRTNCAARLAFFVSKNALPNSQSTEKREEQWEEKNLETRGDGPPVSNLPWHFPRRIPVLLSLGWIVFVVKNSKITPLAAKNFQKFSPPAAKTQKFFDSGRKSSKNLKKV